MITPHCTSKVKTKKYKNKYTIHTLKYINANTKFDITFSCDSLAVQSKRGYSAREGVAEGTKVGCAGHEEEALQIQTLGEYKYIYKYKDKQRTQSGGPLKREDFERKIPIENV